MPLRPSRHQTPDAMSQQSEGSVAEPNRSQTRIRPRDEEDEEKQTAAQASSHVSPAMRAYRHALESIFALLELDDLARILSVSQAWSAAVRSMAPISGSIQRDSWQTSDAHNPFRPLPPIAAIIASPLLRHLAALDIRHCGIWGTHQTNASLALLAQHVPNLTLLRCELALVPTEPLVLPPNLDALEMQLERDFTDAEMNGMLTTLATLPSLSQLCLFLSNFKHETAVDLSLLAACRSLVDLKLVDLDDQPPRFSDAQVEQIRTSLGHLQRFTLDQMVMDELAWLLRPPVTVRWQDIGLVMADAHTGDLLRTLNTLTKLDLCYHHNAARIDFLSQLPHLTELHLDCSKPPDEEVEVGAPQEAWFVPARAIMDALMRCTGITELELTCGFNSAQCAALFSKLTQLFKLTLRRGEGMDTLACFAAGPITESLEELTLEELALPPSEVSHMYALRHLRSLWLNCCFSSPLDEATIDSFTPPTAILPALEELVHIWNGGEKEYEDVERRGPSLEWISSD